MTPDPVATLIQKLTENGKGVKQHGKGFAAQCPSHDDHTASLMIAYGDRGAVLKCHAGCTTESVVTALGLKMDDLFDQPLPAQPDHNPRPVVPGNLATYYYDDENGKVLFRVERRPNKQFVQARPDPIKPGEWVYNLAADTRRVPYHLAALRGAIKVGEPVYIVEGEKDVERLEQEGYVATCNPGGAGKFRRDYAELFNGAHVVIIPDNDGPGKTHAASVVDVLKEHARTIRLLELPGLMDKQDVYDWLSFGNNPLEIGLMTAALTPLVTNAPTIFNAEDLMNEQFPDVVMAVPGIIAEGCTLLVGAPKIGKSWMALGLGLAVATGENALTTIPVTQGRVLYMALEDTPRRLQRRLAIMIGTSKAPRCFEFACNWPRMDAGGVDQLEDWLKENTDTRMVIVDTWAKFKPGSANGQDSQYGSDYFNISQIKGLADTYGTAIVLVHHQRKMTDSDPLNTVAGSTGLTGASDATVILTRTRGSNDGYLYVTGRDVEETKSLLNFAPETGTWTYMGSAEEVEESRMEDKVRKYIDTLDDSISPPELVDAFKDDPVPLKSGTAKWLLAKLAQECKIFRKARGQYISIKVAKAEGLVDAQGRPITGTPSAQPPPTPLIATPNGFVAPTVQPPLPGTPGPVVTSGLVPVDDDEAEAILDALEFDPDTEDEDMEGGDDE